MKVLICVIALTLPHQAALAAAPAPKIVRVVQSSQAPANVLRNDDVLALLRARLAPETVVARIKNSACDFDTAPGTLQKLRADGVPDSIILAMATAPKGVPAAPPAADPPQPPRMVGVKIPDGTVLEVETAYAVSSQDVKAGDAISFRVVNPLVVDGATVIRQGATATGRVVRAKRGGHFGRAGRLAWSMQDVTAADGARLPLRFSGRVVGDSKGAKVATRVAITGVILWPIAPVALLHGFKRGKNAYLPAGKRFEVAVQGDALVTAPAPR
jgi:hypothetical protein